MSLYRLLSVRCCGARPYGTGTREEEEEKKAKVMERTKRSKYRKRALFRTG